MELNVVSIIYASVAEPHVLNFSFRSQILRDQQKVAPNAKMQQIMIKEISNRN